MLCFYFSSNGMKLSFYAFIYSLSFVVVVQDWYFFFFALRDKLFFLAAKVDLL